MSDSNKTETKLLKTFLYMFPAIGTKRNGPEPATKPVLSLAGRKISFDTDVEFKVGEHLVCLCNLLIGELTGLVSSL